jgi:hypothetical protein
MRNFILILSLATSLFYSCTKTDASGKPVSNVPTAPITPAAGGAGGGGAAGGGGKGGGAPTGTTNLDIYTKQVIGGWNSTLGFAGTQASIKMVVRFAADGTFNILETADNGTGAQSTILGTWQLSIPANLPLDENALLTMNSGGQPLTSGLIEFFHPGTFIYTTTLNNLVGPVPQTGFVFQRLP